MNKRTRMAASVLILCLLVSLMYGCSGTPSSSITSSPAPEVTSPAASATVKPTAEATTAPAVTPGKEDTPPPTEEPSPYNFAKGKFTVNSDGLPTSQYEYTMPLSTTDEVFSWWTTCWVAQYIPEEGYGSMNFRADMMKLTGVNLEWDICPASTRSQNFAVLLASDDLRDISASAWSFFTGTVEEGLEDHFANLYDYRDYIPNYLYQVYAKNDVDVTSRILYDDETIIAFYCIYADPLLVGGLFTREDWLQKLGMTAKDIVTYEDTENMLMALKVAGYCNGAGALLFYSTLEQQLGCFFAGFDTSLYVSSRDLPLCRVVDGQVQFTLTNQDDYDALKLVRDWSEKGLIYPTLLDPNDQNDKVTKYTTGEVGLFHMQPGEIKDYETNSTDPDCKIRAVTRPVKNKGDILKYGQKPNQFQAGSSVISKSCSNIPLVCTFCDWWYSDSGSFYFNFGKEGEVWEYNADGEIQLTDFLVNNPMGMSWALSFYAGNGLTDHGLQIFTRKYLFPGGEEIRNSHYVWLIDGYKGEYDFPGSVTYTPEEDEELSRISGDLVTYIAETFMSFYDGSKPLAEWNNYLDAVSSMGLDRCREIRQAAYERFMVRFQ
ncbi:MAG: hypothetical protein IKN89_13435 [Oscillospiraceae bacterium]|nr:hypothetical protein [Oscillospiraceae bacterium]